MKAIMERAGIHSEARTVMFSVPVEEIVGLTSLKKECGQEEGPQ